MDNDGQAIIEEGAAGAPEGTAPTQPTNDEVGKMYEELGIKAPAPTGKTKGRPKSSAVRDEDISDDNDADTKHGRKDDKQSSGKSKDAPSNGKDGDSGNDTDAKASKDGKSDGKVQDKSEEADGGVREGKSDTEGDSKRGGEDGSDDGADGAGQAADDKDDTEEEGDDAEKGKRPGKSNPEVEKRMQRLATERKEALERAEAAEQKLQEATRSQEEAKIAQEDPEYTIDDFRKVRDEDGNVLELDQNQAELAWRRWQDGYNQRKSVRDAEANRQAAIEKHQEETAEKLMRSSVEAYDSLASLADDYPELVSTNKKFSKEFTAIAMPIIRDCGIYQPGTEPGNEEGLKPVIIGLRIDPRKILDALKSVRSEKRDLPLNGTHDNVDTRSKVNVPHGRSSDPTVNAANELYETLGIKKRL